MGKKGASKKLHPKSTAGKPSSPGKKSKGKGSPEKKGSDKTSKQSLVIMEPIDVSELAYTQTSATPVVKVPVAVSSVTTSVGAMTEGDVGQSTSSAAGPKPPSPAGEEILGLLDVVQDLSKVETLMAATDELPAKPVSRPSDDKQSTSQAENKMDEEVESSKRAKAKVIADKTEVADCREEGQGC